MSYESAVFAKYYVVYTSVREETSMRDIAPSTQ